VGLPLIGFLTRVNKDYRMPDEFAIHNYMQDRIVTVSPVTPLKDAVAAMVQHAIGSIIVLEDQKLCGIFTERDMLQLTVNLDPQLLNQPIENFMSTDVITVDKDEIFASVFMKMKMMNIRHLPVIDGDKVIGIVSIRDLLRHYQNQIEAELVSTHLKLEEMQKVAELDSDQRVVKLNKQVEHLERLSLTDGLTGLYNIRYFSNRLKEEVARAKRYGCVCSLLFIDIDFFKRVNDTHGHHCGDKVLKIVADILMGTSDNLTVISRLRKSDIVARYGGEEFVIILPETDKKGANIVGKRIRRNVEEHEFTCNRVSVPVTVSVGIASIPEDAESPEVLIRNADEAMYRAKQNGRNRVELF
jgi:diguanylate cyclase (GGDEF)-like protein